MHLVVDVDVDLDLETAEGGEGGCCGQRGWRRGVCKHANVINSNESLTLDP